MKIMNCLRGFFVFISFLLATSIFGQQIPADLSNLKASQISNAQLQQYIDQAKQRGLTVEQVESELLQRGFPETEMAELRTRIRQLNSTDTNTTTEVNSSNQDTKRKLPDTNPLLNPPLEKVKTSKIFGAELFSNSNLSFEPDLRMATPKNYVIGPDDELLLNIYGLNMSQQTLKVSPEGNVNVKYAGVVNVNGLTIEGANSVLKSRLAKYYPALNSGQTKLQLALGNIRSIRVILIGAINRPGTYTLPSLANLFNALYVSGGPAENGSLRNIELIRNNKVIQKADLYDFLVKGDLSSNVRLEDNDVIRIPFATTMVTLNGLLNRPGIFELNDRENLKDAITYAGGFKSKAFKGRITGNRYSDFDKRVIDVSGDSLQWFAPKNGDEYFIDSVVNRYQNRVIISGAVFKPGPYAINDGMTLKQLINKAQGLKEDVYTGRALVVRTKDDLSKEYIAVELKLITEGKEDGLYLKREDSVHIASIFDLKDTVAVTINGAVRNPGTYRFEEGLSLKSLILKAQGFSDEATGQGIEISRRKRDVEVNKAGSNIVELITVNDSKELSGTSADVQLKPFDIITVKEDPYYKKQISVKVTGEVLMPAVYTLQSREERLSSIIQRAGGLLYTANIGGAKLVRQKKEIVDTSQVKRLLKSVARDSSKTAAELAAKTTTDVAIDLRYILKHPGSIDDITLEEGDELIVPRINNTVSVNGEVFKSVEVMYEKRKNINDYLSDAGGVTQSGKKGRAFVIYPNGGSAQIKKPLGIFRSYPKIEPGSSIFVPEKRKKEGIDAAKAGIIISAISGLLTAAALILRL
jgi:protein involved in polysaccharide export with SLBB domain